MTRSSFIFKSLFTEFLLQISLVGAHGQNGPIVPRMVYALGIVNVWWILPVRRNVVVKNLKKLLVCQENVKVSSQIGIRTANVMLTIGMYLFCDSGTQYPIEKVIPDPLFRGFINHVVPKLDLSER